MLSMRRIQLCCLTVGLLGLSISANAQPEPNDLGVFFDAAGTQTAASPPLEVEFEFWITAFDLQDLLGFEMEIVTPPELIVMYYRILDPNMCGLCMPPNYIVGLNQCTDGSGVHPLFECAAINFTPGLVDGLICVRPATPSSFESVAPGYLTCTEELIPFGMAENGQGIYPDGCGVLYPTQQPPIAAETQSWSAVKSRFALEGR